MSHSRSSVPALLHTLSEAAKRLSCCPRTIRREIDRGRIRAVKLGRQVRISEAELRRLVADGTHP